MYDKTKLLEENNPYYRNVGKELIYNLLQNNTKQDPVHGDKPLQNISKLPKTILCNKNDEAKFKEPSSKNTSTDNKSKEKERGVEELKPKNAKDKIAYNIEQVKTMKSKNLSKFKYVDDPKGTQSCHINPKTTSGLLPVYGKRSDLGKIPKYLEDMKRIREETEKAKREFIQEQIQSENGRKLSEDERLNYLKGLKKNLEKMTHEYYSMGIVMPTKEKHIRYRENLERKMEELENCITLLCNNKIIIIPT